MTRLPNDYTACADGTVCRDHAQCLRYNPEPAERRVWANLLQSWLRTDDANCPHYLERKE